jgi:hypothetical protein
VVEAAVQPELQLLVDERYTQWVLLSTGVPAEAKE